MSGWIRDSAPHTVRLRWRTSDELLYWAHSRRAAGTTDVLEVLIKLPGKHGLSQHLPEDPKIRRLGYDARDCFLEKRRRDERILNQEEIDELLAQLDVEEAHGESQPDCLAA